MINWVKGVLSSSYLDVMGKWSVDERYPWSKVASFDGDLGTEEVIFFVPSLGGGGTYSPGKGIGGLTMCH